MNEYEVTPLDVLAVETRLTRLGRMATDAERLVADELAAAACQGLAASGISRSDA